MKVNKIILVLIFVVLIVLLLLLKMCAPDKVACIRVTDAVTQQPIEDAGVWIETDDKTCYEDSLLTDEDGECTFPFRDTEKWLLTAVAAKEGYRTATVTDIQLDFFLDDELEIPLTPYDRVCMQVVDARTQEPIPGASVFIDTSDSLVSTMNMPLTTDSTGHCCLYYDDGSESVPTLMATATHLGYSGRRYQRLTLGSLPDVIPLEPMRRCNDGQDNMNLSQGGHSVQDFFFEGVNGTFQFYLDYYTAGAPDHIMVYEGSSEDYIMGRARLLWEFNDATQATNLTDPNCPRVLIGTRSPIICIVVDNDTNPSSGTYWGYFVHCPQP